MNRYRFLGLAAVVLASGALAATATAAPGPNNAVTDVPGVEVGHDTNEANATGTTVVFLPRGALVGVSPSGGAPGNRVTSLLHATYQDSLRTPIYGILLNGGSIFGLQAACGVVKFLQEEGLGIQFGGRTIPLVPGAIIFDLGRGQDAQQGDDIVPDQCENGYRAASNASGGPVEQGSVGAGTGARSGGLKGGVGTASSVLPDGTVMGAVVIVNSAGRPYNDLDGCSLYTLWLEQGNEFGSARRPPNGCRGDQAFQMAPEGQHTTIGVVATDAPLSAAQAERMAQAADDGFARAIRPAHTPGDGDTIYGVSTAVPNDVAGSPGLDGNRFREVMVEAADVYARAITHAILAAENLGVADTYCERFPTACPPAGQQAPPGQAAAGPVGELRPPSVGSAIGLPAVPATAVGVLALLTLRGGGGTTRRRIVAKRVGAADRAAGQTVPASTGT